MYWACQSTYILYAVNLWIVNLYINNQASNIRVPSHSMKFSLNGKEIEGIQRI